MRSWVKPGTHINAIGADAPGKEELEPDLVKNSKIIIDNWEQASHSGEINKLVEQALIGRQQIHAELGQVLIGKKEGRINNEEITIFDTTGLAIQDISTAFYVSNKLMKDKSIKLPEVNMF